MTKSRITNKQASKTRCFACDRIGARHLVDTRDDQTAFVGSECFKKIEAAGERGYLPPKGGPRLYPLKTEAA